MGSQRCSTRPETLLGGDGATRTSSLIVTQSCELEATRDCTVDAVLEACENDLIAGIGSRVMSELSRVGYQNSGTLGKNRRHDDAGIGNQSYTAAFQALRNAFARY